MKITAPSVEILRTGLETEATTPEEFIEKVGRTCYKSEEKITDTSAEKFVSNLINRGHEAMIEHWNLIFRFKHYADFDRFMESLHSMESEGYQFKLRVTDDETDEGERRCIISGNMRAWRDYIKAWVDECDFIPYPLFSIIRDYPIFFPEYQSMIPETSTTSCMTPISVSELTESERQVHQDVTVKFVCDRGVSHEIVRHRVASFAQESTRYCNYSKAKFGNEITVVRPSWCVKDTEFYRAWVAGCADAEKVYFTLINMGCSPQEARSVLPNSLKTEIIVTMNLDGWDHFFNLRCASSAHPDMQEVAGMAEYLFDLEVYAPTHEVDEDDLPQD